MKKYERPTTSEVQLLYEIPVMQIVVASGYQGPTVNPDDPVDPNPEEILSKEGDFWDDDESDDWDLWGWEDW